MAIALPARFKPIANVLAEPLYGRYVAGNSISLIGTWLQRTAVGWLAWELTHSTTWVGLASFADLFPTVFIGPFGGVLADRMPRRRIMLVTQILLAILASLLCLLVFSGMMTAPLLVDPRRGPRQPRRPQPAGPPRPDPGPRRAPSTCRPRSRSTASSSMARGSSGRRSPASCWRRWACPPPSASMR